MESCKQDLVVQMEPTKLTDFLKRGAIGKILEEKVPNYKKIRMATDIIVTIAILFMIWNITTETEKYNKAWECRAAQPLITLAKGCWEQGYAVRADLCSPLYYDVRINQSRMILLGNYSMPIPTYPTVEKLPINE